jgi:hypothetical protein
MRNNQSSLLRLGFFTFLVYAFIFIIALVSSSKNMVISITLGYVLGLLYIVAGYLSIRWAFKKKQTLFLIVILGGMAIRFILFAFVLLVLVKFTEYSLAGFLFSFFLFYLFLQIQEIRFVNSELKSRKGDAKTGYKPDGGGTR